jgi:hypothetical protein
MENKMVNKQGIAINMFNPINGTCFGTGKWGRIMEKQVLQRQLGHSTSAVGCCLLFVT